MNEPPNRKWYALQVRAQLAQPAAEMITQKGFETFLPTYSEVHKWSDRLVVANRPLFPGYLFCRFNERDRLLPILTTPGVISIVSAGRIPVPLRDQEIDAIQSLVESGLPLAPYPELAVGTRVLMEKGPLIGVEGIILSRGKTCTLAVSVEILGRSVVVEIDREWARVAKGQRLNFVGEPHGAKSCRRMS